MSRKNRFMDKDTVADYREVSPPGRLRGLALGLVALLGVLGLPGLPGMAFAVAEVEPNNLCASAQDVGAVSLPYTQDGNLDSSVNPDVEFFKFIGAPGATLRVALEGESTGNGTLPDPLLGFFDSSCNLVEFNNNNGANSNSRLIITIPEDGIFILAAASCCDLGFQGGGNGDYRMTIRPFPAIGSISGRMVDAVTGQPLPGNTEPFSSVQLFRCKNGPDSCLQVGFQRPDNQGAFHFTQNYSTGQTLREGQYQMLVFAQGYALFPIVFLDVTEGEHEYVGVLFINPIPIQAIGSISGRVVDARTGLPLRGDEFPFAAVSLHSSLICSPSFDCSFVTSQATDNLGRFNFTQARDGSPLPAGRYSVRAFASQYQPREIGTGSPDVAEDEDRDVGDIVLEPLPVQVTDIVPCMDLPAQGGRCLYSVRVTNRMATNLEDGRVWSIVNGYRPGFVISRLHTVFQTGKRNLILSAGESTVVQFGFEVPETLDEGSFICPDAWVGSDQTNPYFDPVGSTFLFCIRNTGNAGVSAQSESGNSSGGFEIMPMKKAYELYMQRQGHGMIPGNIKP